MSAEVCPTCHQPISECVDPDRDWFPQRTVCYATMAEAAASRMYDALHEKKPYHDGTFKGWRKDFSTQAPFHYRDGVKIWVSASDLSPDDAFLSKPKLRPTEQSPGEDHESAEQPDSSDDVEHAFD